MTRTETRNQIFALVHVYKEIAEELDLEAISRDFVRADEKTLRLFLICFLSKSIKHYSWCYCGNVSSNYEY